jgi:hypothetical protein
MDITLMQLISQGVQLLHQNLYPLTCSICTNGLIQLKDYIFYYIFIPNIKRIRPELSELDFVDGEDVNNYDVLLLHFPHLLTPRHRDES